MLAMRCELLLGIYQAADPFGPADSAEWPPHPYRLHAALVAAACEAGGEMPDGEDVAALRWLEEQGPPLIACAPNPPRRTVATSWVPRNATPGAESDRYAKSATIVSRVGRTFPTVVPGDPVITFTWPDVDDVPPRLVELVVSVGWLGSSRSPVACSVVETKPEAGFTPSVHGEVQARVAQPGLTDALLASRFTHPGPVAAPVVGYARPAVASLTAAAVASGQFAEMVVRRVRDATQDAADTATVTAALRSAVLSRAGDDAPAALHGHELGRGHAAYLSVVDVGHPGAKGAVRGVALALPSDLDPAERRACLRAFAQVDSVALPGGATALAVEGDADDSWTLPPERWLGPATVWSTVTPVVLDRFPRRGRTAADELVASIANARLPVPEAVDILPGPSMHGAPLAGRMRGVLPDGLRVHARVRFAAPVRGPVLVGRGRFRGIGFFLPEPRW